MANPGIGKIYSKLPSTFYECNDGTFSDHNRTGACNYHGGLKEPQTPVTYSAIAQRDAIEVNATGQLVPLKQIHTDPKRFQNRDEEFSADSVNRILTAIKDGSFKFELLDKILLWRDPSDLKLYVLSGHSRFKAFTIASAAGLKVDGRTFDKIPAEIILNADFEQARHIALTSNTLSTKESDTERAKYYRELRKKGSTKSFLESLALKQEGKASNQILNFSYLNPTGPAWESLKLTEGAESTSRNNIRNIADWVGEARRSMDPLTDSHENELFKWLTNGAYGTRAGQISNKKDFLARVYNTIQRRTNFGVFDAGQPLNIENLAVKTSIETDFDKAVAQEQQALNEAKKALDEKRQDLIRRNATPEQLKNILQDYQNRVILANQELVKLLEKRGQVREASRNQGNLFAGAMVQGSMAGASTPGIASVKSIQETPHIARELFTRTYDHTTTAGYGGRGDFPYRPELDPRKPTYQLLPSYDAFFDLKQRKKSFVANAGLMKTIATIKAVINETLYQTVKIAAFLKAPTLEQSAYNTWHFLKTNVLYKLDEEGSEQIREPNRSWADKDLGIDCEDFNIFSNSILVNMGYLPKSDVVAFGGNDNYGHIFCTVGPYVCDEVMDQFNKRPPNISKTMIIERLAGVQLGKLGAVPPGQNIPLVGFAGVSRADELTRNLMDRQSYLLQPSLAGVNETERQKELRKLRFMILLNGTDDRDIIMHLMPHVDDIGPDGEYIFRAGTDVEALNDIIDLKVQTQELGKIFKSKKERQAKKAVRKERKTTKRIVRTAKKKERKAAGKGILRKAGKLAKKVGKAVVRFNPATILVRNAYLLALKINFGRMSSRLKWSYLTESEARAKGFNMAEWQKLVTARKKTENIFTKIGGKPENMKNAMIKGGKGLSGYVNYYDTFQPNTGDLAGLGVVATTTVAAAMPAITATLALMSKINFKELFAKSVVKDEEESTTEAAEERVEAEATAAPQAAAVNSMQDTFSPGPAQEYQPIESEPSEAPEYSEDEAPLESEESETEYSEDEAPLEEEETAFIEDAEVIEVPEELENLGSLLTVMQALTDATKAKTGQTAADRFKSLIPVLNRRPERNGKVKKAAKKITAKVTTLKKKVAAKPPIPAKNKGFKTEQEQKALQKTTKTNTMARQSLTAETTDTNQPKESSNTGLLVFGGLALVGFLVANK